MLGLKPGAWAADDLAMNSNEIVEAALLVDLRRQELTDTQSDLEHAQDVAYELEKERNEAQDSLYQAERLLHETILRQQHIDPRDQAL
jgi:hypothetical protein